jgi:MOSC domain-containing protein YiiM
LNDVKSAKVISLQVGQPRTVGSMETPDPMDQIWTTGFFKEPTSRLVWLGKTNLEGDGQADLENHGGPEKAVNVYPIEHYPYWTQTLALIDLPLGAFGENFTTEGLLEGDVCIGDVFKIGETLVQISQPRQPCWKLARRWRVKDLAVRVQETGRTGWYFRVLREGRVQAGSNLVLVERPCPRWTVTAANTVMHDEIDNMDFIRDLAECSYLSSRWRSKLKRRVDTGTIECTSSRLDGPSRAGG